MSVERMAELRRQLAQTQSELREESDRLADCITRVHIRLLKSKDNDIKAVGSSEDARKLAFADAVLSDTEASAARRAVRALEYHAALYTAELEALKDARREREILVAEAAIRDEVLR